jgi:cytochrome c peroxidase
MPRFRESIGVVLTGVLVLGVAVGLLLLPGFGESGTTTTTGAGYQLPQLLGLKDANTFVPADNPLTAQKVELGRLLFFDTRLSRNNSIACASCHVSEKGFTDGMSVPTGINNLKGKRSALPLINRVYSTAQFWDGRAETLEDQSIGPFIDPVEHGFINHAEMIAKMRQIPGYRKLFQDVFGREIVIEDVGRAIASFQRTILSGNSAMDKFDRGWEEEALSESAQRGLDLFRVKGHCTRCHAGFNFTDEEFHNIGIGWDTNTMDLGRYLVTKNAEDIGAFKTPTLREIARTAPYMHDGRFKTLEEVVNFYNQGGIKNPYHDDMIVPLELTEREQQDLVAMLKSLNGEGWQHVRAPKEFPK